MSWRQCSPILESVSNVATNKEKERERESEGGWKRKRVWMRMEDIPKEKITRIVQD